MQEWEEKILEKRKALKKDWLRDEQRTEGQTITLIQQMKRKFKNQNLNSNC